ncbi:hypothetical protein F4692_001725 [Nocardioides cavernae]|uniref:Uncharacterized protein n=1 Tax=Nocardioides cavernae TaxID=1921566 RepID=A0A7Y9H267_9ACTN|nr:hypothetical protein [Nocardioides cavernae]NYE36592.1 hypothetical protein [Nocardioides cavernae]
MSEPAEQPRPVLQKLLTHGLGSAIVDRGYDHVGGIVVLAGDAAVLDTPDKLLGAYGFEGGQEFVDVVRFELPPLATLANPVAPGSGRTPLHPTGFLRADAVVPVWELSRTRYSFGAEYWRIRADGEQKVLSAYQGAARGWRGAKGWSPWSPLVGPRARWRGTETCADLVGDSVLLSVRGDDGPAGWEQVRPQTWVAAVPAAECELFEVVLRATWRGVPVRILASGPSEARVLLLVDDEEQATALGADVIEPGVFEATVARSELSDLEGVTHEVGPGVRP